MADRPSRAVVLLSGGMDSATALAQARQDNAQCYALSFYYGQRHAIEIAAARRVAEQIGVVEHRILTLDLAPISRSSLTDTTTAIPTVPQQDIPSTYVPARNTIFLATALAWAETLDCQAIYIGVNAVDYSGYPDCRPEFIQVFQQLAHVATCTGVEGKKWQIITPLIDLSKADIIRLGVSLGVDYSLTVSCYQANEQGQACGKCDACRFRKQGFAEAGVADPTQYIS